MISGVKIVCLCGSTRFRKEFDEANIRETLAGRIVLSVCGLSWNGESPSLDTPTKLMLDEIHKRKIELADEILVLNVGGYVGDSTRSEIDHARKLGRGIRWMEPQFAVHEANCDRCGNRRTIEMGSAGGDYETRSCPVCRGDAFSREQRGY